jgi:SH3-like domain-containing protein
LRILSYKESEMKLIVNIIVAILLCSPQIASAVCVQGNCTNGHGTAVLPDGSKYVGEFREGVRSGRGSMTYPDGTKYVGDWQNDKPHGKGTLLSVDKFEYTGEFANGVRHGQGTLEIVDGKKYVGQWQYDAPHGQGKLSDPGREEYTGQFKNGQRNGQGEATYSDGTRYKGQWANDLPNGQGVKILADGMQYSGEFKNGLMYGNGTIVMPDGSQIKIQWQSDLPDQKEEKLSDAAVSSDVKEKDWYMVAALGKTQGRPSMEPQGSVGHMEVSSQELAAGVQGISPQEVTVPVETAEQVQTEAVNEIQTAETEKPASEAAELPPQPEVSAPVETLEQVPPQATVQEEVAVKEQVQTEAVNEIQPAEAEEIKSEIALSTRKEDGSGPKILFPQNLETSKALEYATIAVGANIRSDASLTSEVLRTVPPGYPVAVLERQGDWFLVQDFRERKGWVFASFVTELRTVIIKVYKGNLRSGPSLTDDIIVQLDHGTVMAVLERSGEWLKVSNSEELTGWLNRKVVWP